MGMDLDLGIAKYAEDIGSWWLLYDRLRLDRDYNLFDQFVVLTREPIPTDIKVDWYSDDGVQRIKEDAYGNLLRFVRAGEFNKIELKKTSQWNKAVFSFLRQIPPDTPVVLYWC
jgi:hypothetical protein